MFNVLEVFWIHFPHTFVLSFIAFGIMPCYSGFSGALHEEVSHGFQNVVGIDGVPRAQKKKTNALQVPPPR
jgi:hypothetical protein